MTERGKHVGAEKIMYSMKRQHKCKKKKKRGRRNFICDGWLRFLMSLISTSNSIWMRFPVKEDRSSDMSFLLCRIDSS